MCLVTPIAILLAKSSETSKYNLENLKDMLIGAAPAGAELEQLLQLRYPWIQIRQSNYLCFYVEGSTLMRKTFESTTFKNNHVRENLSKLKTEHYAKLTWTSPNVM